MDALTVRIPVRRVARVLLWTVVALALASFVAQAMNREQFLGRVARFLDSDQKLNFPSTFKELALVSSTVLFALVATTRRRRGLPDWKHWWVLAGVFAFLTLDEMTYAHQSLNDFIEAHWQTHGILEFAWVVVYLPLTAVVVVVLIPFVRRLPRELRTALLVAGALYAGGAGGFELVKGALFDEHHFRLSYGLAATTSDTLEMAGLAFLVVVLLTELAALVPAVHVVVDPEGGRPARAAATATATGSVNAAALGDPAGRSAPETVSPTAAASPGEAAEGPGTRGTRGTPDAPAAGRAVRPGAGVPRGSRRGTAGG